MTMKIVGTERILMMMLMKLMDHLKEMVTMMMKVTEQKISIGRPREKITLIST